MCMDNGLNKCVYILIFMVLQNEYCNVKGSIAC